MNGGGSAVLVTGGAGYIGSHAVLGLVDRGQSVVVLDDLSTGELERIPEGVPLVRGDVADGDLVRSVLLEHQVRSVMHFAGSIIVPESVRDPAKYYRNNTVASFGLIETCSDAGVGEFIFSSTAAVYGSPVSIPVSEDALSNPMSPYGASKLMTESMLRDISGVTGMKYAILRYFNVAGADPAGRSGQMTKQPTHLIERACLTAIGALDRFEVFGTDYDTADGSCIRDYIHVSDLIDAHLLSLDHLAKGGESLLLNCGYGRGYSVLEVVRAVERASGKSLGAHMMSRREGDPPEVIADATRLREKLGWRPKHDDLDAIVASIFAWRSAN